MTQSTATIEPEAPKILWEPSGNFIAESNINDFRDHVNRQYDLKLEHYNDLYDWSIDNTPSFWSAIWDYCEIIALEKGEQIVQNPGKMPGAQFFPDAKLNYAENLLRQKNDEVAIIFNGESKVSRQWSWANLHEQVSLAQQALNRNGITAGDRVAGLLPNIPKTISTMLGCASIGAIWSSASPDFGVQGVIDRFGQIAPKILFAVDGYYYNGKWVDCLDKISEIIPRLPTLEKVVLIRYGREDPIKDHDLLIHDKVVELEVFLSDFTPKEVQYTHLPFNHPLFIMFSSGTTGAPKCITHSAGGALIQHLKEHQLHCNIRPADRVFYYTTCGWMMWNWLVSALASKATLVLYDGSPFFPNNGNTLFDYAETTKMTLFGTSAKFIDALKKRNYNFRESHDLSKLRTITSTGSPLVAESFDYVYSNIKQDVHLASISGGTDIVSCFVLGNPVRPVWRGEIQGAGLGMAMDIWDDEGNPAALGKKGELVCTKPFPCMPIGFWGDDTGERYFNAYFSTYDNIWHHGDFAEKTAQHGFIIHGRSDATLNPGGVRLGTAEIYRQVEQLPEITESIAIGQQWRGDERIILFVTLHDNAELTKELKFEIKSAIKTGASPRHVPAKIIQVKDIPRTKSGKISEIAVRNIVNGRAIKNKEALANPECLDQFADISELGS